MRLLLRLALLSAVLLTLIVPPATYAQRGGGSPPGGVVVSGSLGTPFLPGYTMSFADPVQYRYDATHLTQEWWALIEGASYQMIVDVPSGIVLFFAPAQPPFPLNNDAASLKAWRDAGWYDPNFSQSGDYVPSSSPVYRRGTPDYTATILRPGGVAHSVVIENRTSRVVEGERNVFIPLYDSMFGPSHWLLCFPFVGP